MKIHTPRRADGRREYEKPWWQKDVLVNGCFDLMHLGHIMFIRWAAGLGRLTVAVTLDEEVEKKKGRKPLIPAQDRISSLMALRDVYRVIGAKDPVEAFDMAYPDTSPDLWVVGWDHWEKNSANHRREIREAGRRGIGIVYAPPTLRINSTTSLIERIRNGGTGKQV